MNPPRTGRAWLTTPDRRALLAPASSPIRFTTGSPSDSADAVIEVDEKRLDQPILGFGAALTDSSAWLIQRMPPAKRAALLRELFDRRRGLGFSVLRLPMGASDFSTHGSYTYNDLPEGEKDPQLSRFSIAHDQEYILPLLRQIRQINPDLVLMASPWTAPAWMKTNHKLHGGWLDWPAYAAYARYFVKFLEAYRKAGVPVQYVTVQNEPRHETDTYPSMRMEPRDQARFVRDHLGPAFARAGLRTRILVWDHNWDAPDYPREILEDAGARRYIAGVAWHAYAGEPEAQEKVRQAFPKVEQHFTESSGGAWASDFGANVRWDVEKLITGSVRHGARSVLKWNLALDENHGPRNGGCPNCRGVVTIHSRTGEVTRNEEYYAFGHASRFVRAGARRISSSEATGLPNVTFRNTDRSLVWIVCNQRGGDRAQRITLRSRDGGAARVLLPPGATMTVRW